MIIESARMIFYEKKMTLFLRQEPIVTGNDVIVCGGAKIPLVFVENIEGRTLELKDLIQKSSFEDSEKNEISHRFIFENDQTHYEVDIDHNSLEGGWALKGETILYPKDRKSN